MELTVYECEEWKGLAIKKKLWVQPQTPADPLRSSNPSRYPLGHIQWAPSHSGLNVHWPPSLPGMPLPADILGNPPVSIIRIATEKRGQLQNLRTALGCVQQITDKNT